MPKASSITPAFQQDFVSSKRKNLSKVMKFTEKQANSQHFENILQNVNGSEYSHRNLAIVSFLVTAVRINLGGLLSCLVLLSSSVPELTRHVLGRGLHVNP